jgi:hypothetical protein
MTRLHRQKRLRCMDCARRGQPRTASPPSMARHRKMTGHSDFQEVLVVREVERRPRSDRAVK